MIIKADSEKLSHIKGAIVYARFSPRPDANESESNDWQIEYCKEWLDLNNIPLVYSDGKPAVFSDSALSGDEHNRPGLWDAVDLIRKDRALVAYRLDRIARGLYLPALIEHAVIKAGGLLVSTSGEGTWDDSPEAALQRSVINAFNEFSRKMGNIRTSAAMQRHIRNGRMMGKPKWGMHEGKPHITNEGRKVRTVHDYPREILISVRAIELDQAGVSRRQIPNILHAEGMSNRNGNKIGPRLLYQILAESDKWIEKKKELKSRS